MCDLFLPLLRAPAGLSCFLLPRVVVLQAALLVRHAPAAVGGAFCASRLGLAGGPGGSAVRRAAGRDRPGGCARAVPACRSSPVKSADARLAWNCLSAWCYLGWVRH